jgi:hypothetical protein
MLPLVWEREPAGRLTQAGFSLGGGLMRTRVVYIIGFADCPVKIGIATDPYRRLSSLQVGNHQELFVHHLVHIDKEFAPYVEHHAHKALKAKRIRGEWFNVSAAEALEVVERIAVAGTPKSKQAAFRQTDPIDRIGAIHELSPWAREAVAQYRQEASAHTGEMRFFAPDAMLRREVNAGAAEAFKELFRMGVPIEHLALRTGQTLADIARCINLLAERHAIGRADQLLTDIESAA